MPVLKIKKDGAFIEVFGAPSEAEKNVQVNWTETDQTSDAYIQNKPTFGTLSSKNTISESDLSDDLRTKLSDMQSGLETMQTTIDRKADRVGGLLETPIISGAQVDEGMIVDCYDSREFGMGQVRNIILSPDDPSESYDCINGDIWIVYEV